MACRYGEHADDQWSMDGVLAIAERFREPHAKTTMGAFLQELVHDR